MGYAHKNYEASDEPILIHREEKHLEFLREAKNVDVVYVLGRSESGDNLNFPSNRVAKQLEGFGALQRSGVDAEGHLGYSITELGKRILTGLTIFAQGDITTSLPHTIELRNYWERFFPFRLVQFWANAAAFGSSPDTVEIAPSVLRDIDEKKCRVVATAVADAIELLGSPETYRVLEMPTLANPHTVDENLGGRITTRLDGWSAHCRVKIEEQIGVKSDTELIQYLLTLGLFIALHKEVQAAPEII